MAEAVAALGPPIPNVTNRSGPRGQTPWTSNLPAQRPVNGNPPSGRPAPPVTATSEFVLSAPDDDLPLGIQPDNFEPPQAQPPADVGSQASWPNAFDSPSNDLPPPGGGYSLTDDNAPVNAWNLNPAVASDAPEWYAFLPSSVQLGPMTADDLQRAIDAGQMDFQSLIWRQGWPEWQKLSAVFPRRLGRRAAAPPPVSMNGTGEPTTDNVVVEALAGEAPIPVTMVRGRKQVRRETRARVSIILFGLTILMAAMMAFILMKGHAQKTDAETVGSGKKVTCCPASRDLAPFC